MEHKSYFMAICKNETHVAENCVKINKEIKVERIL
jgi:hypothetical protein